MTTPFENLRSKLREAGCRVEIGDQFKSTHGANVSLLLVYPEGGGFVRCLVIDEREEGYHLFIENAALAIDSDVQAILSAESGGRLGKAA
jgi:hypothetical protein